MPVTVRTGAVLSKLFDGKKEVEGEGATVGELLEGLGVTDRLCDGEGKVRRHFNIHINEEEDIRLLQGLDTPVKDGDSITILSALAGGAEIERKYWITFRQDLVEKPLIWEASQKFKVVTNIRQASISREIGIVGLVLSGDESEVAGAVKFLEENGVSVEPVELDIVE